jgi:putative transposase
MIGAKHPSLSVKRQCALLELPRSTYHHRPGPETNENLALMRVIDETYLAFPVLREPADDAPEHFK